MSLTFDPAVGFTTTDVADIREQVRSMFVEAFREENTPELNTEPETPAGQLIDSLTAAIAQKDAEIAYLANMFNPLISRGKWQEALGKIYFLNRKGSINSSAVVTLHGIAGTQISAGLLIKSENSAYLWSLDEDATIGVDGTVDATFTCQETGPIECGVNTLSVIVTTTPGLDYLTNEAGTVGSEAESQSAFEERRYNSVGLNSRGTVGAVYARVANCDGVISCYVDSNRTNELKSLDGYSLSPHSIFVAVTGGENTDIAQAIYDTCAAGCDYNGNTEVSVIDEYTGAVEKVKFLRPTAFDVYVKVTIYDNGALPNLYESIIKDAVYDNALGLDETMVNGEPMLRYKMNDDVFASRFIVSILNAGITTLLTIQVSSDGENWVNNIHIPAHKTPEFLKANINVVKQTVEA